MTDHAATFASVSAEIQKRATEALSWASGRTREGISDADVPEAQRFREAFAALKEQAEQARDTERLPLVEQAQAVQSKWAPHLVKLKGADDVLRHALKTHAKLARQKKQQGGAA